MSEKQVFLCQWDYMINCNENDNEKTDHLNKTFIDQDLDRIQNIACLGKTMPLCNNKQHLSNIVGSVHWKIKQHSD